MKGRKDEGKMEGKCEKIEGVERMWGGGVLEGRWYGKLYEE